MTNQTNPTETLTEVTTEQWDTIRPDLEKLLKIKQKPNEALPAYALRLAKAASDPKKVGDDAWETLEEITQQWVNGATLAHEKGEPLPLPVEASAAAPVAAAAAADGGSPTKKAKKTKAAASSPPKKKEAKTGQRGRPSKYGDGDVIRLSGKENPHRKGSKDFEKFRKLRDGQTIGKALAADVDLPYLRYLAERRALIKIERAV